MEISPHLGKEAMIFVVNIVYRDGGSHTAAGGITDLGSAAGIALRLADKFGREPRERPALRIEILEDGALILSVAVIPGGLAG
jgi:hypothetical protein